MIKQMTVPIIGLRGFSSTSFKRRTYRSRRSFRFFIEGKSDFPDYEDRPEEHYDYRRSDGNFRYDSEIFDLEPMKVHAEILVPLTFIERETAKLSYLIQEIKWGGSVSSTYELLTSSFSPDIRDMSTKDLKENALVTILKDLENITNFTAETGRSHGHTGKDQIHIANAIRTNLGLSQQPEEFYKNLAKKAIERYRFGRQLEILSGYSFRRLSEFGGEDQAPIKQRLQEAIAKYPCSLNRFGKDCFHILNNPNLQEA